MHNHYYARNILPELKMTQQKPTLSNILTFKCKQTGFHDEYAKNKLNVC